MVRGVLAPHAIVGPAAKGQEVVLARHILRALRAEAVWVKGVCLRVALHGKPEDDDSQTPMGPVHRHVLWIHGARDDTFHI